MNRNALTIDGPAPVASTYMPDISIVEQHRILYAGTVLPRMANGLEITMYSTPRCSPDRARICEAPLLLNAVTVELSSPSFLPVRRAFNNSDVFSEEKGMWSRALEMVRVEKGLENAAAAGSEYDE